MKLEYLEHERTPILTDLTGLENNLVDTNSDQINQINAVDHNQLVHKVKIGLKNDPKLEELDTSVK